jgi:hypothetical protein
LAVIETALLNESAKKWVEFKQYEAAARFSCCCIQACAGAGSGQLKGYEH